MRLKALHPFSLVGGTALSLRYGHRTSADLDLFYHEKFDHGPIVKALEKKQNCPLGYILLPGWYKG